MSNRSCSTVLDLDRFADQHCVSRETIDRLTVYVEALQKWAKRINLIGPGTTEDIWQRHIADSLQLLSAFDGSSVKSWVDFGTGAGLPGMVIATALRNEDVQVHLVESNAKKTAFLKTVRPSIAPGALIHDTRIEDFVASMPAAPDIVSARAVASLDQLFAWIEPWASANPSMVCHFPKGRGYEKEMRDASVNWDYDVTVQASVVDDESVILRCSSIHRKEAVTA